MRPFRALKRNTDGSVVVEFALLAPLFIGMFFGVMQVGVGMQNYNALRGVSGDVARYAVVNYQTNTRLTTSQLRDYANGRATNAPYGLVGSRFRATINNATTQRVAGATEYTMTLEYSVPTFLSVLGIRDIPLTFTRPIFVISS